MELFERIITVPDRLTPIRIYFSYDWHNGAYGCDHDRLETDLKHILNDPYGYMILGGDMNESISKNDRRHDSGAVHPRYDDDCRDNNLIGAQEDYAAGLIKPLAEEGKILTYIRGNHEEKYAKESNHNFPIQICKKYEIPFGGGNCVAVIKFRRKGSSSSRACLINALHGRRGGGTTPGKVRAAERQAKRIEGCHIYMRGHGHKMFMLPDEHVEIGFRKDGTPKQVNRPVAKGSSGAYLLILKEGGNSYAEDAEYDPTDLGCVYAEILPFSCVGHTQDRMKIELRKLDL